MACASDGYKFYINGVEMASSDATADFRPDKFNLFTDTYKTHVELLNVETR